MSGQEAAPEWRQRGGFSVLFDVRADGAGGELWRTRIYHEESGQEIVEAGLSGSAWPAWILDRLTGRARPGPEPVSVEVVDVRPAGPAADPAADALHVDVELLVHGLAALERQVGAALLARATARRPT